MENHRCWAEINLDALVRNLEIARSRAGAGSQVMAVIKAGAYGHGSIPVARALAPHAAFLGVASVFEAIELQPHLIDSNSTPLYLLGPVLPEHRETAADHDLVPSISTEEEAADFDRLGSARGKRLKVHLWADTGMGRMGFTESTLERFLERHRAFAHLEIDGVASHFPCADEDPDFTRDQIARFNAILARCRAAGIRPRHVHLANSAGILRFADQLPAGDAGLLTRPGLMLYGISPLPEFQSLLEPALQLKTRVTLIRDLPRGHGVSYGRDFITTREITRVATLAIGYGDGYPRHLSNSGAEVLIRGRRCPLLGRVTMDQIMVDLTAVPETARPGDEAVLIGTQGGETILATELAAKSGTIAWEILTRITGRVQRVYLPRAAPPR